MATKKQQEQQEAAEARAEEQGNEVQSDEEVEQIAQEREEALETKEGQYAGGTPGGASESQQPPETQSGPASVNEGGEGVGSKRELPDLDPETQAGVTPRSATAVNPGDSYDDDAAGGPIDDGSDNDNDKG